MTARRFTWTMLAFLFGSWAIAIAWGLSGWSYGPLHTLMGGFIMGDLFGKALCGALERGTT